MSRIKLNRPPPVSSDAAHSPRNIVSGSKTEDVHAADIYTVCVKDPSDLKLINRKGSSTSAEDTRKVVKHKHVVRASRKEHCTSASENRSFVSDSHVKKTKKRRHHCNVVTQADSVQRSSPNDDTEPHCNAQYAVASSGGFASFSDNLYVANLSQETVMHIEPQQSGSGVNKNLSGSLLDDVLKGFLAEKLAVIENERKGANVDHKDDSVETAVQSKPAPKLRRSKCSRKTDEQQQDLDFLPSKSRYTLLRHDDEYTKSYSDTHHMKSHLDYQPHAFTGLHDRLPPRISYGSTAVEDVTKDSLSIEGSHVKSGYRKHHHKQSLHANRHLEKNKVQTEYKPQSFDFFQLEGSHSDDRKSIDCLEQIRAFVSHTVPKFAQPVGQDHVLLENYHQSSTSKLHGRKRQKSGSTNRSGSTRSHHCRHHHNHHHCKKQKITEHLTKENKRSKRGIGKKSLQTTKTMHKRMLMSQKRVKHRHKHHRRKTSLPHVHVDYKNLNKDETLLHVETKDEADAFSKGRSLSPLGMRHKHRLKHKKKKSSEKDVSAENVPVLPEKIVTQYDKISSDEEFIPMKVQRSKDDDDTAGSKAQHKMEMPDTDHVKRDQTNRKSALELKNKFLKLSGKRPKRRMHLSDANPPAEGPVSSDNVQNIGSFEEHPIQDAAEHFQAVEDAADANTTDETQTLSVAASQGCADEASTSHEVATAVHSTLSEDAVSCSDKDDKIISQTVMIIADHASDDGHICSIDEVSATSQMSVKSAADGDNLTDTFVSDRTVQLGEIEQETAAETGLKACGDSDSAETLVLGDHVAGTVSEEELKSCPEEYAAGDVSKSKSDQSEALKALHPDIEPDALREKATVCTEREDKGRTEVVETEEISAVKEKGQNNADQQSVSDDSVAAAGTCPLQLNQMTSIETLPACASASGDDSSITKTAENTSTSTTDYKDSKNHSVEPGNVMGPPLALPPSVTFKKPLPVMKMRLRITDTSADIISSGAKNSERDKKEQNEESREEGNQIVSISYKLLLNGSRALHDFGIPWEWLPHYWGPAVLGEKVMGQPKSVNVWSWPFVV